MLFFRENHEYRRTLSFSGEYIPRTLIEYILLVIENACYALPHATKMRKASKFLTCQLKYTCLHDVYEVLLEIEVDFDPGTQADDLGEATGSLREKQEVSAEVLKRSADFEKALY